MNKALCQEISKSYKGRIIKIQKECIRLKQSSEESSESENGVYDSLKFFKNGSDFTLNQDYGMTEH